jgi:hypothetical protein
MPMMAITTKSSTNVKPLARGAKPDGRRISLNLELRKHLPFDRLDSSRMKLRIITPLSKFVEKQTLEAYSRLNRLVKLYEQLTNDKFTLCQATDNPKKALLSFHHKAENVSIRTLVFFLRSFAGRNASQTLYY